MLPQSVKCPADFPKFFSSSFSVKTPTPETPPTNAFSASLSSASPPPEATRRASSRETGENLPSALRPDEENLHELKRKKLFKDWGKVLGRFLKTRDCQSRRVNSLLMKAFRRRRCFSSILQQVTGNSRVTAENLRASLATHNVCV